MSSKTDPDGLEDTAVPDRANQTYHRLREMILSGELPGGSHLKQVHLAHLLKISQTPVREAMKILEREGWVVSTFNKGKIVRTFGQKDLQDVYEVREMLEGLTARKAATSLNEEQLTDLEAIARLIDEKYAHPTAAHRIPREKADMDFHMSLATYVGNQQVVEIFQRLIHLEALLVARSVGEPNETLHIHIVQAIKSRDAEWAEMAARRHIREAWQKLIVNADHLHQVAPDGSRRTMKTK